MSTLKQTESVLSVSGSFYLAAAHVFHCALRGKQDLDFAMIAICFCKSFSHYKSDSYLEKYCLSQRKENSHACDCLTQIGFVELDLLHHRCHDKGEGLPVEEVQRVADEHATEDGRAIVAIACGPHVYTGFNGCKQTT